MSKSCYLLRVNTRHFFLEAHLFHYVSKVTQVDILSDVYILGFVFVLLVFFNNFFHFSISAPQIVYLNYKQQCILLCAN